MDVSSIVFWLVVLGLIGYVIGIYNRLVTLKNRYLNAFAQIEVQLKRRYDLIPNLVEVAKGYMVHERETLEAVIAARNNAAAVLEAISKAVKSQIANVHLRGRLAGGEWVLDDAPFGFYEALDTIKNGWGYTGPLTLEPSGGLRGGSWQSLVAAMSSIS